MEHNIAVTVIIRTHNRPELLRRALDSVQNQTRKPDEVVVVEDGPANSIDIINEFNKNLHIVYHATYKHVGRVRAANIGLELARGKYINFLDDDDLFLPHHIEVMFQVIQKENADCVHSPAIERKMLKNSHVDVIKYNEAFDKELIFYQNLFPIQAVMFKRELYEKYGGMDPSLELLEDWDLWIRYGMYAKFHYIDQVCSIYHVPADSQTYNKRIKKLKEYEKIIWVKYRSYMTQNNYKVPGKTKRLLRYVKKNGIIKTINKIMNKNFYYYD